jgi:uncharacterized protein with HEPN domain
MGVTIHYRGKLKSPDMITGLMHEVEDICIANSWKHNMLTDERPFGDQHFGGDDDFFDDDDDHNLMPNSRKKPDLGLRGITFQPHEDCETITFLFDTEGVLQSLFSMIFGNPDRRVKYPHIFVKTQFSGIETHIKIINLLVYLKKKYFKVLHITDEGGYYPKKNIEALSGRMEFIGNAIDTIRDVFENAEFDGSPEEVMAQMRDALSRSLKGAQVRIIKFQMGEMPEELFPKRNKDDEPAKDDLPDDGFPF